MRALIIDDERLARMPWNKTALDVTRGRSDGRPPNHLGRGRLKQIKHLKGKEGKAPPFPENPIDPFAALEFFVLFPGELTAQVN